MNACTCAPHLCPSNPTTTCLLSRPNCHMEWGIGDRPTHIYTNFTNTSSWLGCGHLNLNLLLPSFIVPTYFCSSIFCDMTWLLNYDLSTSIYCSMTIEHGKSHKDSIIINNQIVFTLHAMVSLNNSQQILTQYVWNKHQTDEA